MAEAIRAAQYLRMSTEHQKYSPEFQAAHMAAYAVERGYQIVKTYSDLGISGLHFKTRKGLQQLLSDALGGGAEFTVVLVFDVSRWGRFQDPDQAAHYEFLCREAGIQVEYCAEMFENDGSLAGIIIKNMRRVMAAEFSRDLSAKVLAAQLRMAAKGFKQGGGAPYGMRRLLLDELGEAVAILEPGERKALKTHRIIMIPGPSHEVETVRRIFRLFVFAGMTRKSISAILEAEERASGGTKSWRNHSLRHLLQNRAYAGDMVFNRTSQKLGTKQVHNPENEWVTVENAYEPIVRREVFEVAQRAIRARCLHLNDEQMINRLKELLIARGYLSETMISSSEGTPCAETYRRRFGSLPAAFKLAGYHQTRRYHDPHGGWLKQLKPGSYRYRKYLREGRLAGTALDPEVQR